MSKLKSIIWNVYTKFLFLPNLLQWRMYCNSNKQIKLIVGASKTNYPGWFPTEQFFFDLINEMDYKMLFKSKKFDYLLAEHVLEHIPNDGLEL